jgi:hypothetical protein
MPLNYHVRNDFIEPSYCFQFQERLRRIILAIELALVKVKQINVLLDVVVVLNELNIIVPVDLL